MLNLNYTSQEISWTEFHAKEFNHLCNGADSINDKPMEHLLCPYSKSKPFSCTVSVYLTVLRSVVTSIGWMEDKVLES